MKYVHIETGAPYDVLIDRGLIDSVGALIEKGLGVFRVALISDKTVDRFYGDRVERSLCSAGHRVLRLTFEGGEASKTPETVIRLQRALLEGEITRSDLVVALGGGIVGDVAGFTAATYLRGIRYVQIPTTLLAALDSSVGGKTGVNLLGYKNQIGAFWQPSMVLCDPDVFSTLPEETYADGMAEAIKYGVAFDKGLFEMLYADHDICEVIRRAVAIKGDVVASDERDEGVRQLLNFGHTVGHAIEKLTEHEFTHGQAVAVGMIVATRGALRMGYCRENFLDDLVGCITYRGLPNAALLTTEELISAMRSDKKRRGDEITLILPRRLGECHAETVPMADLEKYFRI